MFKGFLIVLAGLILLNTGVFAQSNVNSDTVQTNKKHVVKKAKAKSTTAAHKPVSKVSKNSLAANKKKGKKSVKSNTAV